MRSKCVLASVLCVGVVIGFVAAAFLPWSSADADDEEKARLYVNCPKVVVQPIVDFVVERGGTVHDMDSFEQLRASQKVPPVPPLQSSVAVMEAIYEAIGSAMKDGDALQITQMSARDRAFKFTVRASSYETVESIRKALNSNAYLRSRMGSGGRAELGSAARGRDGRITQDVYAKLREPVGSVKVPEFGPETNIGVAEMETVAAKAGMQAVMAGAERRDVNRRLGTSTISRDFTYAPTELVRLRAFLKLLAAHPDYTVIDVRFGIDEKLSTADQLFVGQSTIKVARYAPNPPK